MESLTALTKGEEQVMLKLWRLKEANVEAIKKEYINKVPAYNTISTIIRILEKKGFIDHSKKGRGYVYFPKVSKDVYAAFLTNHLIHNYYEDDRKALISKLNQTKSLKDLL